MCVGNHTDDCVLGSGVAAMYFVGRVETSDRDPEENIHPWALSLGQQALDLSQQIVLPCGFAIARRLHGALKSAR
jgi:hypothetical protein